MSDFLAFRFEYKTLNDSFIKISSKDVKSSIKLKTEPVVNLSVVDEVDCRRQMLKRPDCAGRVSLAALVLAEGTR